MTATRRSAAPTQAASTKAPATTTLERLRAELMRIGEPERAVGMRHYLRSEMPCHGVRLPVLRAACKSVFAPLGTVLPPLRQLLGAM